MHWPLKKAADWVYRPKNLCRLIMQIFHHSGPGESQRKSTREALRKSPREAPKGTKVESKWLPVCKVYLSIYLSVIFWAASRVLPVRQN